VRQALEEAGLTQDRVRELWGAVSPCNYYDKIAGAEAGGPQKKVLMVYADYDLTFPKEYSLQVVEAFKRIGLNFERRVLPCGHYTTGESPYQYLDGWYLGSFVYRAFKALREEKAAGENAVMLQPDEAEEAVSR
jgi:pimeloyl-ACP methyl ester carboxylesterase